MALRKEGDYYYGKTPTDLLEAMTRYAKVAGLPPIGWLAYIECTCGSDVFEVDFDEPYRLASRYCVGCEKETIMSGTSWTEGNATPAMCLCYGDAFQVLVGIALNRSNPERGVWFYLGGRCIECGCMGCYADWELNGTIHEFATRL